MKRVLQNSAIFLCGGDAVSAEVAGRQNEPAVPGMTGITMAMKENRRCALKI
jgi:hypothetical protein